MWSQISPDRRHHHGGGSQIRHDPNHGKPTKACAPFFHRSQRDHPRDHLLSSAWAAISRNCTAPHSPLCTADAQRGDPADWQPGDDVIACRILRHRQGPHGRKQEMTCRLVTSAPEDRQGHGPQTIHKNNRSGAIASSDRAISPGHPGGNPRFFQMTANSETCRPCPRTDIAHPGFHHDQQRYLAPDALCPASEQSGDPPCPHPWRTSTQRNDLDPSQIRRGSVECLDILLSAFLNGLILDRRDHATRRPSQKNG